MDRLQKKLMNNIHGMFPTFVLMRNKLFDYGEDIIKVIQVHFVPIGPNEKSFSIYFDIYAKGSFGLTDHFDIKELGFGSGVLSCGISDIINDFKGYKRGSPHWNWTLRDDNTLFDEVNRLVKNFLVPFVGKANSLQELNDLVDNTDFPAKHYSYAEYPFKLLELKFLAGKDDEFYALAKSMKEKDNDRYGWTVDKLLEKKTNQ